ncbi:hypothetical protein LDHU3_34.0670:CDS1 [Leishmania donovani]|uniref:Hypothetical_protein n=1 Tax=Leishmania donovani TaxID=5661 RepID=A0A6J8FPT2_LEIDO|nr:hypothetical protein LDHU3_34.0670:CDS1 [Leishmania donovani]VDZ48217.1 hypothetical_protein [Leishmania donovani]
MKSSAFVLDKSLQAKCVDRLNGKVRREAVFAQARADDADGDPARSRQAQDSSPRLHHCSDAAPTAQPTVHPESSTSASGSGLAIHVAHATVIMPSGWSAARPQKRQFPGPFSMVSLEVQALQERRQPPPSILPLRPVPATYARQVRREYRWPASKH